MSTQKGNLKKKNAPKHRNTTAFKNDMHDTSGKMKKINSMTVGGVCDRCKETIQWKIKYKKYKPLTQAKKCTKCSKKMVKHAYHIICAPCATETKVCAKCGDKKESIHPYGKSLEEQRAEDGQIEAELRFLSERKRRAFFRYQGKGCLDAESDKESWNFEDKEGDEGEDTEDEIRGEVEDEEIRSEVQDEDIKELSPKDQQCDGTGRVDQLSNGVGDALNLSKTCHENSEDSKDVNASLPHNSEKSLLVHFEGDALSSDDSAPVQKQETL